jgi:hypothetical protein
LGDSGARKANRFPLLRIMHYTTRAAGGDTISGLAGWAI